MNGRDYVTLRFRVLYPFKNQKGVGRKTERGKNDDPLQTPMNSKTNLVGGQMSYYTFEKNIKATIIYNMFTQRIFIVL